MKCQYWIFVSRRAGSHQATGIPPPRRAGPPAATSQDLRPAENPLGRFAHPPQRRALGLACPHRPHIAGPFAGARASVAATLGGVDGAAADAVYRRVGRCGRSCAPARNAACLGHVRPHRTSWPRRRDRGACAQDLQPRPLMRDRMCVGAHMPSGAGVSSASPRWRQAAFASRRWCRGRPAPQTAGQGLGSTASRRRKARPDHGVGRGLQHPGRLGVAEERRAGEGPLDEQQQPVAQRLRVRRARLGAEPA
jgi:hypothetical protein